MRRTEIKPPLRRVKKTPVRVPEEPHVNFEEFLHLPSIENEAETIPSSYGWDETELDNLKELIAQRVKEEDNVTPEILREQITTAFKPVSIAAGGLGDFVNGIRSKGVKVQGGTRARSTAERLEKYISYQIQAHVDGEGNRTTSTLTRNEGNGPPCPAASTQNSRELPN